MLRMMLEGCHVGMSTGPRQQSDKYHPKPAYWDCHRLIAAALSLFYCLSCCVDCANRVHVSLGRAHGDQPVQRQRVHIRPCRPARCCTQQRHHQHCQRALCGLLLRPVPHHDDSCAVPAGHATFHRAAVCCGGRRAEHHTHDRQAGARSAGCHGHGGVATQRQGQAQVGCVDGHSCRAGEAEPFTTMLSAWSLVVHVH